MSEWKNKLYYSDNLDALRDHIEDESIDLVYLDPPFNSQSTYNILFAEKSGKRSEAQIAAFEDTWEWGEIAEITYHEIVTKYSGKIVDLIQALRSFLGQNDMMAYLVNMSIRLIEIHRVLKPTGSLYLHCDPTASHYLKLILDSIFSPKFFRNEISWKRYSGHGNVTRRYGSVRDIIFFYTKSSESVWNPQYGKYNQEYIDTFFKHIEEGTERRYRIQNVCNPNLNRPNLNYEWNGHVRVWKWTREKMQALHDQGRLVYSSTGFPGLKQYLDESKGPVLQDNWDDIPSLQTSTSERLGYPTQKPEALLERIIKASSNEGDIVLDPFCGCGTTIAVAEKLRRRWIGIDITYLAINLIIRRMESTFRDQLAEYEVIGIPKDLESARELARKNHHQFELWVLGRIDARPFKGKKGADTGIDGIISLFDDKSGQAKKIIVQVKGGHVDVSQIRDLKGVLEREQAIIGVFVTMNEPTKPMIKEALSSGYYLPESFPDSKFNKIQILTIDDIFKGKKPEYKQLDPSATYKAAKVKKKGGEDKERQKNLL